MTELEDRLRRAFDAPPPVALDDLSAWAYSRTRRRRRRRVGVAIASCVGLLGGLVVLLTVRSAPPGTTLFAGSRPLITTGPYIRPAPVIPVPSPSILPAGSSLPASASGVLDAPIAPFKAASKGITVAQLTGGGPVSGQPPLSAGGKPEVLYIGAGYCPFCAAEQWPLVAALAKFGTFTNLSTGTSSPNDTNPNTPTFNLYGSSYSSPYVTFTSIETSAQDSSVPLQKPTPAEEALWEALDPNQSIPFIDFANRYQISGATYVSTAMANQTFDAVAAQVGDNNTAVGRGIDQAAGAMIKAICNMTAQRPADACSTIGS